MGTPAGVLMCREDKTHLMAERSICLVCLDVPQKKIG
jgi:hypothetical protein